MTGDACAKTILLGEHVVVEGAPALLAGLAAGMTARVVKRAEALRVSVRPWTSRPRPTPRATPPPGPWPPSTTPWPPPVSPTATAGSS